MKRPVRLSKQKKIAQREQRLLKLMTSGFKLVPRKTKMTDEKRIRLVTTDDGEWKLARLIAPLAWESHDIELLRKPKGSKDTIIQLSLSEIHEIEQSKRIAKRIIAFCRDNLDPEVGQ